MMEERRQEIAISRNKIEVFVNKQNLLDTFI